MRTTVHILLLAGWSLLLSSFQVPCALAADLFVPPSWAGKWQITVTYRDSATDDVVAVDNTTDFLRSGEPIGLEFFSGIANCSGKITDNDVEALCTAKFTEGSCSMSGAWQLSGKREGNSLTGSGAWSTTVIGDCGSPLVSASQTMEFSGLRLSLDQAAEPNSSLLEKFVSQPMLLLILPPQGITLFANFRAMQVKIKDDEFKVKAIFTLGDGSNGIKPLTEAVTLSVGTFITTIPASSFTNRPGKKGRFELHQVIDGVFLEFDITSLGQNRFKFEAKVEGANLSGPADPLFVGLRIGDDQGITLRRRDDDDDHEDDSKDG